MVRRALEYAGRLLVAGGVLLLLFTAYQLWGTGIITSQAQARLRSELVHELPPGVQAREDRALRQAGLTRDGVTDKIPRVAPRVPTPSAGSVVGTIDIPSIHLDMAIIQGVAATDLSQGPGHYPDTPLPGEAGNAAIAGHRTTYLHPFYSLTAVANGDPILITTPQGIFTYTAVSVRPVVPTDLTVIAPTTRASLTLTTCNPRYSAAQRLVLRAYLTASQFFGARSPHSQTGGSTGGRISRAHSKVPSAPKGLVTTSPAVDVPGIVLWGGALVGLGLVAVFTGRRLRRRRWLVYPACGLLSLFALFFFFGAVSPLLPSTF